MKNQQKSFDTDSVMSWIVVLLLYSFYPEKITFCKMAVTAYSRSSLGYGKRNFFTNKQKFGVVTTRNTCTLKLTIYGLYCKHLT